MQILVVLTDSNITYHHQVLYQANMARINVIVKQTGQRGTIEQNEYNPNIYQLEQTTQKLKHHK